MIGNSINKTILANVRIAGNTAKEGEPKTGGTYVPAYVRTDGKFIRARWYGQICINANYTDAAGKLVEKRHFVSLTVWNGPNADSGERMGMADVFAKNASTGREIKYMEARILPYTDNVYDSVTKKDVARADGTLVTCDNLMGAELINADTFSFGDESAAEITRQEALWTPDLAGKAVFFARPSGMTDAETTAFNSLKKSVRFSGGSKYFGFARVGNIPKGARLAHGEVAGISSAVLPGVAHTTPDLNAMLANADLSNPAVVAALTALGLTLPNTGVASASPAVSAGDAAPII